MPKTQLAFGVEPDLATYRLRLARYPALTKNLQKCLRQFDDRKATQQTASRKYNLLDVGVAKHRSFNFADHAGLADQFEWHGVDIADREPPAKLQGTGRWTFRKANVDEGIPYPDDHFDVVICEQVLEHLHKVDFSIRELRRITRTGGYLIIGVPIFTCPVAKLRNLYIKHLPRVFAWTESGHIQTFCQRSIVSRIEADGDLEVVDVRGFRIISGGILRPLENLEWWYRFSCWLGRLMPWFCTEIQMRVRKKK